jgi:hypothetical protein
MLMGTTASAQPVISNPSFEVDATPPYPGYGTITGWTAGGGISTGYGLNEAGGAFADNGIVPHGTKVAFMQDNGALSQTISGFKVGEPYWLVYRENARGLCCGERVATLSVVIGGTTVVTQHIVPIVGDSNPYRLVTSDSFTAQATDMTLTFEKGGSGDSTALIDNVELLSRDSLHLAIAFPSGGLPAISITGIPGHTITLEYKDELTPAPSWRTLFSFVLNDTTEVFLDGSTPTANSRFYRAWQTP